MPAWLSGGLSRAMRNEPFLCVCLESIPNYLVSPSMVVFLVNAVFVHMFLSWSGLEGSERDCSMAVDVGM